METYESRVPTLHARRGAHVPLPPALRVLFEPGGLRPARPGARHRDLAPGARGGRGARCRPAQPHGRRAARPRRPRAAGREGPSARPLHEPDHERDPAHAGAPGPPQGTRARQRAALDPGRQAGRVGSDRGPPLVRAEARGGALGQEPRVSADDQHRAASGQSRPRRRRHRARRGVVGGQARARQHAVPRLGAREPQGPPALSRAARPRARAGAGGPRAPQGQDGSALRRPRLLPGVSAGVHGRLGATLPAREPGRPAAARPRRRSCTAARRAPPPAPADPAPTPARLSPGADSAGALSRARSARPGVDEGRMDKQMVAPDAWIAVLRIVVGAWFFKAVWTKLAWAFAGGVIPYPVVSARFLGFHPKRVAEFANGNPIEWYKNFLETTVLPNAHLFATLQAYGEAAVGLGLLFGLLTGLAALVGLYLGLRYGLATQWMSEGQRGFHLLLVTSMLIFLCARAGRVF